MPITSLPLDFDYKPSFKIATKHKNAIYKLYSFGGKTTKELIAWYKLGKSTIGHVLSYNYLEQARPLQTGQPQILTNTRVNEIIEYLLETWDN